MSLFETSRSKEHLLENSVIDRHYNFSVGNLVETEKRSSSRKLEHNEVTSLTLKIFADKQYDYDQNIYLAEGNVKTLINGGILRSDLLSYDKLTGILSAEGNIRFRKGGQYFRAKEFKFNLLKKEGIIKDAYGILDLKNVLNDLKIDAISNQFKVKNSTNDKEINTYDDGIEFSFGNIKLPDNKITRSNKSIGLINNWRFKSNSINIQENGWKSNRIVFTNDPFDPNQISFEGIDVIAEEGEDGRLIITSSKTNLILENRSKIFIGKRIFGEKKKKKSKFQLILDGKDRDGLVIVRRSKTTNITNNIELQLQPQFLINRAILGKTNSYKNSKNKNINLSDLFGLNMNLKAINDNWSFDILNDLSTLNTSRLFSGLRHSSSFRKYFRLPILEESTFNIFTAYRSRAWNGTIGETEIKSAFGGFIEKSKYFRAGNLKNNLNIRIGTGRYESEKFENSEIITLWRSSLFSSLDSEYQIWKSNKKNLFQNYSSPLTPVLINSELVLRTNIDSAYFNYLNDSDQGFLKLSIGPEIRLGNLERDYFDYTKLSVMPGVKLKFGNSPFKFDKAIDLKTINISLMQQIYGPLMFDVISNLNIDSSSKNYGEYYDTKLGILWHKRAYECGIYYHPNNDAGGLYFRINGFKFGNSTKAVF
ncbi:DUF3769 domain-containing protein [Prochlorococcus marinus XMU1403]|uniref:DUF3769 domain-containing protein n=1 Tax=Prochlorococcus marinus TaxID=1219 RepID=UPI000D957A32|nr:DUF3769 domain-containing protein [Prochlorococcus marinus]MBW3048755.1 DUF3769 domain-containing protein [Prochlorococcus marinus str. MU1403]PYE03413.1 DUF3769 domain-containing protein [Prochlorococcus marinus XMU1403]